MKLSEVFDEMVHQNILLEKKKKKGKFQIQDLEDFLKDKGVKLDEAKLGSDIPMKDYDEDELQGILDRSEINPKTKKHTKTKGDKYKQPRVHSSTVRDIKITNMSGKPYDLDKLRKMITTLPPKILKKNEKMKNSIGENVQFFNLGLPAIKGLLFDEDDKKFKIVSTCPSAGKCQQYCYAHKGEYIKYRGSSEKATRVLNLLVNNPDKFESMLIAELKTAVKTVKRDNTQVILRWHDSGDFFSPSYKEVAFKIAKKLPDVKFYAYTKDAGVASGSKPDNFIFNFSEGAKASETKKVDFDKTKNSRVVEKKLFWDLVITKGSSLVKDSQKRMQYESDEALEEFKDRLAKKFRRNKRDIILYRDLMKMREGTKMKWTVIVATGDGDDAATRKDVRDTLLLIH